MLKSTEVRNKNVIRKNENLHILLFCVCHTCYFIIFRIHESSVSFFDLSIISFIYCLILMFMVCYISFMSSHMVMRMPYLFLVYLKPMHALGNINLCAGSSFEATLYTWSFGKLDPALTEEICSMN